MSVEGGFHEQLDRVTQVVFAELGNTSLLQRTFLRNLSFGKRRVLQHLNKDLQGLVDLATHSVENVTEEIGIVDDFDVGARIFKTA